MKLLISAIRLYVYNIMKEQFKVKSGTVPIIQEPSAKWRHEEKEISQVEVSLQSYSKFLSILNLKTKES